MQKPLKRLPRLGGFLRVLKPVKTQQAARKGIIAALSTSGF